MILEAKKVFKHMGSKSGCAETVQKDELEACQHPGAMVFDKMNADKDGKVGLDEFLGYLATSVQDKEQKKAGKGMKWFKELLSSWLRV